MKERIKGLIAGILIGIIIATTTVIASNSVVKKDLHYNNIKITMNGEEIKPTDANGNYVEPFIIDGTTYLPVRGIADALDLGVNWDGNTNTVQLHTKNEIDTFIEMYGDEIEEVVENASKESGYTFDAKSRADGNAVIVDVTVEELNGLTDAEKQEIQNIINENRAEIDGELKVMLSMISGLEKIVFNVLENDGDLIAKLEITN